jgi:hypothetical protein
LIELDRRTFRRKVRAGDGAKQCMAPAHAQQLPWNHNIAKRRKRSKRVDGLSHPIKNERSDGASPYTARSCPTARQMLTKENNSDELK